MLSIIHKVASSVSGSDIPAAPASDARGSVEGVLPSRISPAGNLPPRIGLPAPATSGSTPDTSLRVGKKTLALAAALGTMVLGAQAAWQGAPGRARRPNDNFSLDGPAASLPWLQVRSEIGEFAGNYTATYMIEQAIEHRGDREIDPAVLQDQLFDDRGLLSSTNLWQAWKTYEPKAVYDALRLSSNHADVTDASSFIGKGVEVKEPDLPLRAAICMAYLAFNDMAGKHLDLRKGVLPNFEIWTMPWGDDMRIGGAYGADSRKGLTYGGVVVYGHHINPTLQPEEAAAAAFHELGHATKHRPGFKEEELITEFLTTLWHPNTTDTSYETDHKGQYWMTALVSALDDACRNTGRSQDLVFRDDDFPAPGPEGAYPALPPGVHQAGIEALRRAFYGGNQNDAARIRGLLKDVDYERLHTPTGLNRTDCPSDRGELPLGVKIGIGAGGVLLAALITAALVCVRKRGSAADNGTAATHTAANAIELQPVAPQPAFGLSTPTGTPIADRYSAEAYYAGGAPSASASPARGRGLG
jgi:hypothetical protein